MACFIFTSYNSAITLFAGYFAAFFIFSNSYALWIFPKGLKRKLLNRCALEMPFHMKKFQKVDKAGCKVWIVHLLCCKTVKFYELSLGKST